jgi:hypothetical protein
LVEEDNNYKRSKRLGFAKSFNTNGNFNQEYTASQKPKSKSQENEKHIEPKLKSVKDVKFELVDEPPLEKKVKDGPEEITGRIISVFDAFYGRVDEWWLMFTNMRLICANIGYAIFETDERFTLFPEDGPMGSFFVENYDSDSELEAFISVIQDFRHKKVYNAYNRLKPEQILRYKEKNFALFYDQIIKVTLDKEPEGCKLNIKSKEKTYQFVFSKRHEHNARKMLEEHLKDKFYKGYFFKVGGFEPRQIP